MVLSKGGMVLGTWNQTVESPRSLGQQTDPTSARLYFQSNRLRGGSSRKVFRRAGGIDPARSTGIEPVIRKITFGNGDAADAER
jgi:hypothetical protein